MILMTLSFAAMLGKGGRAESWMGLAVAPELAPSDSCPDYSKHESDYGYDRKGLLKRIRTATGGDLYAPYTGRTFSDDSDVHVEHIVARKQAHYSGLCLSESVHRRKEFASDPLNLTLAGKGVNQAKRECDARTWVPPLNRCWFASRVIEVRKKYGLAIDELERAALAKILLHCNSEEMLMGRHLEPAVDPLVKWDADRNGQISCDELREKGVKSPIGPEHEAYPFVSDGNCDGKVC
ncbi:MAG: hypothetical protein OXI66_09735 [Boseongicola sp.]|nr:hypothetical protein [Boseongicola sp.]